MGIFEASVTTSLHCLLPGERFGIVSTGRVWEALLTKGVGGMLGTELSATVSTSTSTSASTATPTSTSTTIDPAAATVRTGPSAVFAGVSTTGLSAAELHSLPSAEVRRRLRDATVRLLTRTPTKASSTDGAFADTDPDTISTGDNVDDTLTVINLGCAGMSGMQEAVREGCVAVLGLEGAQRIRVVDPVLAGVALLRGLIALG
ncbi:MAG: hypothetical protein M1838_004371 [Thelocarpon superellum]|nr:MAG: hypothetical protein M1838_004371 [Thelocarpon superellum]